MTEIDETLLAVACFVLSGRVARIPKIILIIFAILLTLEMAIFNVLCKLTRGTFLKVKYYFSWVFWAIGCTVMK